jgi:DNA-binding NarL/FixJ family response regulator
MSREEQLYPYFREKLEALGFVDITITGGDRDYLNSIIDDLKPRLVIVGSGFYECATPYMMGRLLKRFPKLNIAVVSVFYKIPDDLAVWFIYNGVRSYINFLEGPEEFYIGLKMARDGKRYISSRVVERMNMMREMPDPPGNITPRQLEIMRLLCNGYTGREICNVLAIADQTLYSHKRKLYACLNVRNENELIRAALFQGWIKIDELLFFSNAWKLKTNE